MIPYIGGKYRMAKWIGEHIPNDIELYAEVFGGAFWTYLKSDVYLKPNLKEVYYNDFNRLMTNLFASSKEYELLLKEIERDEIVSQKSEIFDKFKNEILEIEEKNQLKDIQLPDLKLGYKYPYLLTQVFSGVGIKSNTKMQDLKGKYGSKFDAFVKRLKNPEIRSKLDKITDTLNMDFEDVVKKLDFEKAFLYFDPPYYKTENYYSFHDFGLKDHERLKNVMKNMKGYFALSYYTFDDLEKWYPKITLIRETVEEAKKAKRDRRLILNEEEVKVALEKGFYVWEEKEFAKASAAKKGVTQNKGLEVLILNYFIDNNWEIFKTTI